MFSKKATKFDKIFTVDLTLCSKFQIDGEDFVKFCGLLRKHELYTNAICISNQLSTEMNVLETCTNLQNWVNLISQVV